MHSFCWYWLTFPEEGRRNPRDHRILITTAQRETFTELVGHWGKSALFTKKGNSKECDNKITHWISLGLQNISQVVRLSSTTWAQTCWVGASHSPKTHKKTSRGKKSLKAHVRRGWISMEEELAAVENLIRRRHSVGNLSDRSQDVHINTQMLNGWRMSEWKVAAASAKIHSSQKPTQVRTPGTATGSWHSLKWTWHSSLRADVNPGQIITSAQADIFPLNFCLLKAPPLPRGSLPEPGRGRRPRTTSEAVWSLATMSAVLSRTCSWNLQGCVALYQMTWMGSALSLHHYPEAAKYCRLDWKGQFLSRS